MNLCIEIDGMIYEVPLSGETIPATGTGDFIRFLGFSDYSLGEIVEARNRQILSLVPHPPGFTTVAEICDQITGVAHDTVERVLHLYAQQGIVEHVQPMSQIRGKVAYHWMRKNGSVKHFMEST